ncbi:conjugal transfer protein TrbE, partial [Escherichia coli]|nr:conjugal transfer protein TrbE [Escherichia coli]
AIKSMQKSHIRDLSAFKTTIQNSLIRETLEQYTITGSKGHLLDAKEDNLNISTFMTFEIEELMNMPDKFAIPVLLYLFRRIERSLKSQPSAIILDEAWLMLSSPIFREKIREWLKVL